MLRRVMGIETEYGVTYSVKGQRRLSPDEVSRQIFKQLVSWGKSANIFLPNGSRLYLDVGSHPEYASAECDNLYDVVAQDRAGEAILCDLVSQAQSDIEAEGGDGQIYLFKNNTDSANNSYGCHENYCLARTDDLSGLEAVFLPFLITRQIWAGAGKIVHSATRPHQFALSQRAEHMWEAISSATTRSRPMINTRDEPHADPDLYRRLHVIVGDSNMNQFATFLKVGIASLVLAAIEDPEVILRDYTMENPAQVIRDVSYDLWSEKPISLANGRKMTAWEIQDELCQTLEAFVANRDFTDDYHTALTEWRLLLHDYQRDPMSLRDRVDWVAKYEMMSREMSRSNTSWDDPKVALIDLMYHDTHPTRGLFYRYESRGLARTVVSTDAVTRAKETAPSTTRAALRGSFIAEATKWQRDFTVDWVHLKLNDEMQRTVLLKDPFKTFDPRFDDLLQSLQRPPSTNLTS